MKILLLIYIVFSLKSNSKTIGQTFFNLMMNLPVGEYQLIMKEIHNCNSGSVYKIQQNFYLSRNADNSTVIKGNLTSAVPFDDTLFLEIYIAFKDAWGTWKENVFVHKSPKLCSSLKIIFGNEWKTFLHSVGISHTNDCPLPAGITKLRGLDTSIFKKINFPKTFIYGTFKARILYTRKNEVFGCIVYIVEIKRP